jgi:pyrroline-5-carboxylate reductase
MLPIRLTIMGCGKLGSAYACALLDSAVCTSESLHIIQRGEDRAQALRSQFGCRVDLLPSPVVSQSEVVVLCTRPQDFPAAAASLAPCVSPAQLIISVMAGVPLARIRIDLPQAKQLVRCMPNLPVCVAKGVTAYVPQEVLTPDNCSKLGAVFKATGSALELKAEEELNWAGAISGSGPGYVFLFADSLVQAALRIGFSEEQALKLVYETFEGSIAIWKEKLHEINGLKESMRLRGGITEAAFSVLESGGIYELVLSAIRKNLAHSAELAAASMP